jgi:hypothetical protein
VALSKDEDDKKGNHLTWWGVRIEKELIKKKRVEKNVEIKSAKSIAHRFSRNICCYWNALSRNLGRLHKPALKILKFLLFREENPKHQVVRSLHPLHALGVFYFCLIVPSVVFFALMPFGVILTYLGEIALVLGVLELMHILYDR